MAKKQKQEYWKMLIVYIIMIVVIIGKLEEMSLSSEIKHLFVGLITLSNLVVAAMLVDKL